MNIEVIVDGVKVENGTLRLRIKRKRPGLWGIWSEGEVGLEFEYEAPKEEEK